MFSLFLYVMESEKLGLYGPDYCHISVSQKGTFYVLTFSLPGTVSEKYLKDQRSMDRGHQGFWINTFVDIWGWFSPRSWNNTCPLPEQPGVRGQWLHSTEKTPQLWLSLDQHYFLECLCTKESRKQGLLTPSNPAGRLCRHSSWTLMENKVIWFCPKEP